MSARAPLPKTHFTTDRPVAVLMIFIAAVVFGYFSFKRLPVTLMPELNYPTLTVRTEYAGAAPEEIENEISRPIEEALGVVNGLHRISSISRAGLSDVVLEFVWGTDMSQAAQDTLEKLDLVFLPQEAEKPIILHFDPALDPIMELSLFGADERFQGESGLRRLRRLAEVQVRRALEPIPGVAAVRIRGGLEEEIHVMLDQERLRRTGLSVQEVAQRLRQENINVAGGMIKEGRSEFMVRTLNEYQDEKQMEATILRRLPTGEVRVRDVGRVFRAHREREILTRTDGKESVQIDIYKEADANLVAVSAAVAQAVGALQPNRWETLPPWMKKLLDRFQSRMPRREQIAARLQREEGAQLEMVADRAVFIEASIREVRNTAILGGLLAVIVLYLFLRNGKSTAIIALSIPMSLLITFAPLNLASVTLNIMSLGGLALGVGMLVDSSIVVLESIFRCRQEGDSVPQAAIRGAFEVRGAVTASTLTSIAVFFPMVFVEGIAGQVFGDLGMAVVISLAASLLVAIYFIPMLAARTLPSAAETSASTAPASRHPGAWASYQGILQLPTSRWKGIRLAYESLKLPVALALEGIATLLRALAKNAGRFLHRVLWPMARSLSRRLIEPSASWAQRGLDWLGRRYPQWLACALHHPGGVFIAVLISLAVTIAVALTLDSELLPEVRQGELTVEVSLPVGTPLEETITQLEHVEEAILKEPGSIDHLLVAYGFDIDNMKRSDEGEHTARFKVLLKPTTNPRQAEAVALARLREAFRHTPDVSLRVTRPVLFSTRKPISVEIYADDLNTLRTLSQAVLTDLSTLPALVDVETSLRRGAPEIQIRYHRNELSRFGLNIGQVADRVRDMVQGTEATRFNLRDRRIPIVVRLEEEDRRRIEDIRNLDVNSGQAQSIPLDAVADLEIGEGPSEIRRIDGSRVALVEANLGGASLGGAVGAIRESLDKLSAWNPASSYEVAGQNEEWERSQNSLFLAIGLSLFLVYVIMASQFESLLQPLIIMFSVPLAFVGSILGLKLLGTALSVVVFLGWIMLVGIVVNNAIVLVDYANLLLSRGLSPQEAILQASTVRLRPILMTTATTILGLFPMALGLGEGAEIRTPMALAVIFGLMSSTALTLFVVPTTYAVLQRWKARWWPTSDSPSAP